MAYTPTEWKCGDIVTAEKLNAMERGVADMNAEYVPNEWKCGDIVSAEKLNHMEQGIANGCGGDSWTVLTEESVTTESDPGGSGNIRSALSYEDPITANTIKVTLDGNEYTLDATVSEAPGGHEYRYGGAGYTFTLVSYDGGIAPLGGRNSLFTETAGTYTLKIEAPQSGGGSSDFSTAEVTIVNNTTDYVVYNMPIVRTTEFGNVITASSPDGDPQTTEKVTVAIAKGGSIATPTEVGGNVSVSGNASIVFHGDIHITGDCTITIDESAEQA